MSVEERPGLMTQPGFVRFWAADTVSMLGTFVTMLALQLLAVATLHASATGVGVLNAARWVPYLLFGLFAGVLVDRYRRGPLLVGADLARGVLLGLIPLLAALDALRMWSLVAVITVFGALSLLYDAAHQSYLPSLVPTTLLTRANARLEQTGAVAQTAGPLLAGFLVKVIGAPLAILVDAASYLVSGLILATVRVPERLHDAAVPRNLRREIGDGLSWVYRHRMLGPLALTSHGWFLFNSMVATVFVVYALDTIGLTPFQLGVSYAAAGVGAVAGAALSGRIDERYGAGRGILAGRWLVPAGYLLLPFAGDGSAGPVLLAGAQLVFGLAIGIDSPLELAYRQSITPDRLLGRMNATMRSLNRGAVVVGAPLGGVLADRLGHRPTLWIAIAGLFAVALALQLSPFRHARASVAVPGGGER